MPVIVPRLMPFVGAVDIARLTGLTIPISGPIDCVAAGGARLVHWLSGFRNDILSFNY